MRTAYPYAVTGFEPSPQNRVVEQGAPGASWQLPGTGDGGSTGHTLRMVYSTNDQSGFSTAVSATNMGSHKVALYTAAVNADGSRTLARTGNTATYSSGELYLTITRDENWQPADGCLGTTEEYKDKVGHVVLKRTYNKIKSGGSYVLEMLSTYYVYDDMGQLAFVLPPASKGDNTTVISVSNLAAYVYQYRYDERGRLMQKKLPAKGWEYMVYNKLDQVVATQDSVQRMKAPQEWTVSKYDAMGRVILTGIYQHPGSVAGADNRAGVQALVNAVTTLWESRVSTGDGYTSAAWPATLSATLQVNYYDDYDIPGRLYSSTGYSTRTTGLLTASKVNVLGTTDMLWTVNYYDEEGRPARSFSQHYQGGGTALNKYNYDMVTTTYNFNDQPMSVARAHYRRNTAGTAGVLSLTSTDTYSYDHMGRKIRSYNQLKHEALTAQAKVALNRFYYNGIGQVIQKGLHSLTPYTAYLQSVYYRYNERGWLTSINNSTLSDDGGYTNSAGNAAFGMEIAYQGTSTGRPQYNGNISTVKWKQGRTDLSLPLPGQQSYDYDYDRLNRLTAAVSTSSAAKDGFYNEALTYDQMGNITALGRNEKVSGVKTQIDTLSYSYNGNRLTRVDDASAYNGLAGFTDGVQVANEYTYDGNANMRKDLNKGITSINYNMLNLPESITVNGNTVTYTYDASGRKLKKVFTAGSNITTTEYIGGIQYTNGAIDFIQNEEGRARLSGTVYKYEYDLKDHLGNTRTTVTWDAADATQLTPKILQQNDYYAFGLSIKSLEPNVPSPKNQYLYNGKELQDETGLYDYGARLYDPAVGRWTTIDPKSEKYPSLSPYNYVNNNPIRSIDPNGAEIVDANGKPITYTVNKDGSLAWSPNATSGAMTIGNALAKSGAIGDLDAFRDSKVKVSLVYSTANGGDELGHTDNYFISGTDQVAKATVTVFGGSVDEMQQNVEAGKTYAGDKGHLQTVALQLGDKDAVIAGAAGHERIHGTDPQNQKDISSNNKKGTNKDVEAAPNANEKKILERAVMKDVVKKIPCL
ncbi:RHS repeat-associated core domain-containing protein [Mucilaginibacter sp. 14171R-50]|nr:RHS repeat-associated core domain-containing protein [Mucilaginibacter sp. 14171R-50]